VVQAADVLAGASVVLVRLDIDPAMVSQVSLSRSAGEGLHHVQRGLG
jgi:hypothetical protein